MAPNLRSAIQSLGDCSAEQCIIDADFLGDVGFEIVAPPHPYFPRMRLELEQGLGWKADVEAALERLLVSARCSSRWGGLAPAPACERTSGLGGAAGGLFDRPFVRQQFGEGERARRTVVLAE